jgi:hypothetical protein
MLLYHLRQRQSIIFTAFDENFSKKIVQDDLAAKQDNLAARLSVFLHTF